MSVTRLLLSTAVIAAALGGCRMSEVEQQQNEAAPAAAATADAPAGNDAPLAIAAADPALEWGPCPEGMPEGCAIAVLQGDPAKPNADIFFRVPGGAAIPPHAHTSAERMVLVSGELEVKYRGHPATLLRTPDYAYGPAKVPHRADCRSSEPCTLFIAFEGPVDVLPVEGELN